MPYIPINIACEDPLSEAVIRKVLSHSPNTFHIGTCYSHGGFGYLKKTINGFNNSSKHCPFFVLTDLDQRECAPLLIQSWLNTPKHNNLIFRVAVREVESWLLADRYNFAKYVLVSIDHIPHTTEDIMNPKELLINIVKQSRKRSLKSDILPANNSTAKQGPNYNEPLIKFVEEHWNISEAANNSQSLQKTINALNEFRYQIPSI